MIVEERFHVVLGNFALRHVFKLSSNMADLVLTDASPTG
jgi:hypothetical protein